MIQNTNYGASKSYVDGALSNVYTKAEVDTALATKANDNAVVHLAGAETIPGAKTYTGALTSQVSSGETNFYLKDNRYAIGEEVGAPRINRVYFNDKNDVRVATLGKVVSPPDNSTEQRVPTYMGITNFYDSTHYSFFTVHTDYLKATGTYQRYMTGPNRGYNASPGFADDIATIAVLDLYTPMVRTTGNQTIAGVKTFTSTPVTLIDSADGININLRNNNLTLADQTGGHNTSIAIRGTSDSLLARLRYRNGAISNTPSRNFYVDLYDASGNAHVCDICGLENNSTLYGPVLTKGGQTIEGTKTFYSTGYTSLRIKSTRTTANIGGYEFYDGNDKRASTIIGLADGTINLYPNPDSEAGKVNAVIVTGQRAYSAGNTNDVATIGTLDAYSPMVRTSGNQNISGLKSGHFRYKEFNAQIPQPATDGQYRKMYTITSVPANLALRLIMQDTSNTTAAYFAHIVAVVTTSVTGMRMEAKTGSYSSTEVGVYIGVTSDGTMDIWVKDVQYRPKQLTIDQATVYGTIQDLDITVDGTTTVADYTTYRTYTITGAVQ